MGGVVVLLLGLRIAAPTLVQRYVNRTLDRIPEYDGRIGDVDLHLWRGAYSIEAVELVKTSGDVPVPLFAARNVDLSVEWKALVHGKVVGEIVLDEPQINFVSGPSKAASQAGVDAIWIERVKDLFPVKINRVEVRHGTVRYRDFHSNPKVDMLMKQVEGLAINLTNRPKAGELLPAHVEATGVPPGGGTFDLDSRLDLLAAQPTFKINAEMKNVALPSLNNFLRAYGNIDAEGGTISIYAELAAADGAFHGYVKPLMRNVQVAKFRDDESVGRKIWEGIVQVAAKVLENPKEKRVATRVPISGRFDKAEPDLWAAVGALLRNAFIQALVPGIEGSIGLPNGSLAKGTKLATDKPKHKG